MLTPWAAYDATEDLTRILADSEDTWRRLKGADVFITGGTGFIGLWLVTSFLRANEELGLRSRVTILTRDETAFRKRYPRFAAQPALSFVNGDVRSFSFPEGHFSHIIHAAADFHPGTTPATKADLSAGTKHCLEFSRHCAAEHFLFLSSGAVYGPQPSDLALMSEETPFAPWPWSPKGEYAEGKRLGEQLCLAHSNKYELDIKIARGFAFTGPGLPCDAHFAIGNFIRDAVRGTSIQVQGDGRPYRSYLYAADLAIWLWTILAKGRNGRAYNVGSQNRISIAELAGKVRDIVNPRSEVAS